MGKILLRMGAIKFEQKIKTRDSTQEESKIADEYDGQL
jgi:hypothetical protein